ncbi:MAG: carboxypeptidase-like regulatory domain-containing protein, partial [Planctomycetota bacterium]
MQALRRWMVATALLLLATAAGAQAATGQLSGTVTDANGNALAGVDVTLNQGPDANQAGLDAWTHVAGTQTDANGAYRFTGLAERRYRVHIHPGQKVGDTFYISADIYHIQVFDGAETGGMDIKLRQAGIITGAVKDTAGNPVRHAEVVATGHVREDASGHAWHNFHVDADGKYTLYVLPTAGRVYPVFVWWAVHPGATYRVWGGDAPLSGDEQWRVPGEHGYTLLGTETKSASFTGSHKYYVVTVDRGCLVDIDAAYATTGAGEVAVGGAQRTWNVEFTGDNAFQAEDGVCMRVGYYGMRMWQNNPGGGYAVFDASDAAPTAVRLVVKDDGRAADPVFLAPKTVSADLHSAPLAGAAGPDFVMQPAGSVTGKVVTTDGTPLQNAHVDLAYDDVNGIRAMSGSEAFTDKDGIFVLDSIPPGSQIYVSLDGDTALKQGDVRYAGAEIYRGPLTVTAGKTTDAGAFTLRKAGRIYGAIQDQEGHPVVAVEVDAEGRDPDGYDAWYDEDAISDASGQYNMTYLPAGRLMLEFEKDGFLRKIIPDVRLAAGEELRQNTILQRTHDDDGELILGAVVVGKVAQYDKTLAYESRSSVYLPYMDRNGYEDWGRAEYAVLAIDLEHDYTERDFLGGREDVWMVGEAMPEDGYGDYFESDPQETPGAFKLEVPAGDLAICLVEQQGFLPGWGGCVIFHDWTDLTLADREVREDVTITPVTDNLGTLRGTLSHPTGYTPAPTNWARVYAFREGSAHSIPAGDAMAFVGWGNAYEFRRLPAGVYTLRAYAEGLMVAVAEKVEVRAGLATTRDIAFQYGGALAGRVTTANGTPVADAGVKLVESGRQDYTDNQGYYEIKGVTAGTYTMQATAPAHADAEAEVDRSGVHHDPVADR